MNEGSTGQGPKKTYTKEEAIVEVGLALSEAGPMGANDFEIPKLLRIKEQIENDEYNGTLNQAVEEAKKIVAAKQGYH